MAPEAAEISVEVAFALPERQRILALTVPAGTTMLDAVERSGIARMFEGIDPATAKMGIFGKTVPEPRTHVLADGDRVEIYRPLKADPKETRKARARKASAPG